MIEIKVNEQALTLPPGIKLQFELVNSAFDFENIAAGLVWNFDLPADENGRVLDYCHFIDIKNKRRAYDATVILHGKEQTGKLITQKTGSQTYSCSFVVNGFPVDALNASLKDCFTDSIAFIGTPTSQTIADYATSIAADTWPTVNLNFRPYKNTAFYGSKNTTFQGVFNSWDQSAQEFKVNTITNTNYNEHSLSPWLYLCYVVKTTFSALGYTAQGSFFQNAQIKKLMLYSNYAMDKVDDWFKASYTGNQNFTLASPGDSAAVPINDDFTSPNVDPDNLFNTTTYEYTIRHQGTYSIYVNLEITVNAGITDVGIYLDAVFFAGITINSPTPELFTFGSGDVGKKLTFRVYTTGGGADYDITSADIEIQRGNRPDFNVYQKEIVYSNHVPDITVREFLVALRKIPGIKIDYNPADKTVNLDLVGDIFTAKTDNWTTKALRSYEIDTNDGSGYTFTFDFSDDAQLTDNFVDVSGMRNIGNYGTSADLPTPESVGDIALVLNTNKFYNVIIDEFDQLQWNILCDNFYPYVVGDGKTEIKSGFSPLFMTKTVDVLIPQIEQAGSSPVFGNGITDFPLKLVIDYGMQDGFGGNYPLASSYNRDFNGDIIGSLTLRWDDTSYGLYKTFWSKWIPFLMNTETIIRNFNLTINDAFNYLFSHKKAVRNVEHIVKKLTIEVGSEKTEVAEAELCKIL